MWDIVKGSTEREMYSTNACIRKFSSQSCMPHQELEKRKEPKEKIKKGKKASVNK